MDFEITNLRVLPIAYDTGDERWRTMEESETEFPDWPIHAPRSLKQTVTAIRRKGQNFLTHHEHLLKKSGVRATDLSVHEHENICRALHFMQAYDQLSLVNLASAKQLDKRRSMIQFAHQGHPESS